MSRLHHDPSPPAGRAPMPPLVEENAPDNAERAWRNRRVGEDHMIVLTRPLQETEWDMIRAFVGSTDRGDLWLRFGQSIDFQDDAMLKRFFDVGTAASEMICMLDEAGDISGILHRVPVSPIEAEIALIVRSDRKRMGIGQRLLRAALSRAKEQNLKLLRALILRENTPMLRLAWKIGLVPGKSSGFYVEIEFRLGEVNALGRG